MMFLCRAVVSKLGAKRPMGELAATLLALAAVMSGHVTAAPGEGAGAAVPVRISVHDVDVVEGSWPGTRAAFEVQLSSPADHPVEVQFETQDDTALEGVDYLARRG